MVDAWTPLNMHIEIMSQEAQGLPELARTLLPVRSQNGRLERREAGDVIATSQIVNHPVDRSSCLRAAARQNHRIGASETSRHIRCVTPTRNFSRGWTRFPDQWGLVSDELPLRSIPGADKMPWLLASKSHGIYETSSPFVDGFFNRHQNGVVVALLSRKSRQNGIGCCLPHAVFGPAELVRTSQATKPW
jgi:hypothetical protein